MWTTRLEEEGLISGSKRAKSVALHGECTDMAKGLLKKYGLEPKDD